MAADVLVHVGEELPHFVMSFLWASFRLENRSTATRLTTCEQL
jgi:hypothetical protein